MDDFVLKMFDGNTNKSRLKAVLNRWNTLVFCFSVWWNEIWIWKWQNLFHVVENSDVKKKNVMIIYWFLVVTCLFNSIFLGVLFKKADFHGLRPSRHDPSLSWLLCLLCHHGRKWIPARLALRHPQELGFPCRQWSPRLVRTRMGKLNFLSLPSSSSSLQRLSRLPSQSVTLQQPIYWEIFFFYFLFSWQFLFLLDLRCS